MRSKPIENKNIDNEIVCIDDSDNSDDSDDSSEDDDSNEVIEIRDDDYVVEGDGSEGEEGEEEEEEASKKLNSNESAGHKDDDPKNEESWKDDDFLFFTSDDKDDETTKILSNKKQNTRNDAENDSRNRSNSRAYRQPLQNQCIPASTSVTELPPWMDPSDESSNNNNESYCHYYTPPLVKLHNEIVNFSALMSPQEDEIQEREKLTNRVKDLIVNTFGGPEKCKVEVFGSQLTGLFLPSSDIDLVVLMDEESKEQQDQKTKTFSEKDKATFEMENWNVHEGASPLIRLGDELSTKWKDEISFLEVIEKTRIPIVKFTHKDTNLSIDICFNQTTGIQAAELMKKFMEAMPPLKPLTFILKYFMVSRDLNEPYSGGIGSFMLQMMIVSFLQHRAREEYSCGRDTGKYTNLGSLLVEFFELYGVDFNYITTAISVRNDGYYFPKGSKDKKEFFWQVARPNSMALENPFDITSDVGRASFRMPLIQKSFEVSFRILMSHVSEPIIPTRSILATILPTTEEMKSRATLLKVLKNTNSGNHRQTKMRNKEQQKNK